MTDIKLDSRNYRIHDDRNKSLIRKSLQEYGLIFQLNYFII